MKLVLREQEEGALRTAMSAWEGYVSSALLGVEAVRASARHRDEYVRDAREWLSDIALLPLDDRVLDEASSLGPPRLRSLDAIHLATALSVREEIGVFLTYDQRLADAVKDAGLTVAAPA